MDTSRLHHVNTRPEGAAPAAVTGVIPRFSFGWRGFYFAYFYAYPRVGPSPHARRTLTA
jgi:hypothetical protein